MANILKIWTQEQLYTLFRNKILSDDVGLTDFNQGSKVRALLEGNSEAVSIIAMDFKNALYKAIPIALYQGFGFPKKAAQSAVGYIRPYRKPLFWIEYSGSGTAISFTSNATGITVAVTGAPGDAFTLAYASYPTTSDIVDAIDALTNWSATLVKDSVDSDTIYQYTSEAIIDATNYLNESGFDVMSASDIAISILTGYSVTIDEMQVMSTSDETILAGTSGIQCPAEVSQPGSAGNISVNAIDTASGKGYINSNLDGIDAVINDSAFSDGEDEESETSRQQRFADTINALNAGTKLGIEAAIKNITGVRSCGVRSAYPYKGANTIIVDTASGTISTALMTEIEKVLYGDPDDIENYPGKNAAGIEYFITTPTVVDVSIGITIYRLPTVNVDLDEIKTDVQTAIEQYINTRKLGNDVVLSEIIRVSKNSNAAVYDAVITSPAANVSIDGNSFAKTGSGTGGTVTVTMVIASDI